MDPLDIDKDLASFVVEPTPAAPADANAGLMGLMEQPPAEAAYQPPAADFGGASGDGLMGFNDATPAAAPAAFAAPMSSDDLSAAGQSPAVGGTSMVGGGFSPQNDPFSGVPVPSDGGYAAAASGAGVMIPEMTALREWEEKHERELEDKARKEEADKKERRAAAQAELAKWHEDRKQNMVKKKTTNRQEEETLVKGREQAMLPTANPWERVVDLIDTNAQAGETFRDTSRMRSLLIGLKSSPPVAAH